MNREIKAKAVTIGSAVNRSAVIAVMVVAMMDCGPKAVVTDFADY